MENMDNELTVPKSAENTPKFICPSPKVWDFAEKRLHCASVVHDLPFHFMILFTYKYSFT